MNTLEQLQKLLSDIDEILGLGKEGLLKSERLSKEKHFVEDQLKKISKDLDERSQLSIEKTIPKWRNIPKSGIFVSPNEVINELTPLIALIQGLIVKVSPEDKDTKILKEEVVIEKGRPYDGRKYLRELFDSADKSIFIRDSYFKPEILDILLEYFINNENLEVKILMGENNRLSPFQASYIKFKEQYPLIKIDAKYSLKGLADDHPRYVFIDDQLLFNPDHSLDQWGESTVNIHQMVDIAEIEKVKNSLNLEWNTASQI